jgi:hypothetical protein
VTEDTSQVVVAYYAWCMAQITVTEAPARLTKGAGRYPQPAVLLARLGVDLRHEGQGLGAALLQDVLARLTALSSDIGCRGLLVHAESPEARKFYLHLVPEFEASPTDELHLVLLMKDIRGPSSHDYAVRSVPPEAAEHRSEPVTRAPAPGQELGAESFPQAAISIRAGEPFHDCEVEGSAITLHRPQPRDLGGQVLGLGARHDDRVYSHPRAGRPSRRDKARQYPTAAFGMMAEYTGQILIGREPPAGWVCVPVIGEQAG